MGMHKTSRKFPIDDCVPLSQRGRSVKYALADLEAGQYFFISVGSAEGGGKFRSRFASTMNVFENRSSGSRPFTLRTTTDGIRVWHVV
jgi:hypothetical protein